MDLLFRDPVVFTAFVWAKEAFTPDLLLPSSSPLAQLPGFRHFPLGYCSFLFSLSAKTTIPFALRSQNSWFARSLFFVPLFQESPQPISSQTPIDFKQHYQNRQDSKQFFTQANLISPFPVMKDPLFYQFFSLAGLSTTKCGGTPDISGLHGLPRAACAGPFLLHTAGRR
jgi:hypothetical protein